ncbi:MAG: hypothetical protein QGH47_01265, partial [Candidatus Woesearchaeota archaeon]|nr:hypothetical protein [Candidatus Woesearchaeota archaeon]
MKRSIITGLILLILLPIALAVRFTGQGPLETNNAGQLSLGSSSSFGLLQLTGTTSHSSPHILLETPSSVTGGRFYV